MMSRKSNENMIKTRIQNSNVTITFVKESEKPMTDSVISVLSAIYGNRLKQEFGLLKK